MEDTSQQLDSGIAASMERVTVNNIWKILHRKWTVILQVDEVLCSEHHMENISQQVYSGIAA